MQSYKDPGPASADPDSNINKLSTALVPSTVNSSFQVAQINYVKDQTQ